MMSYPKRESFHGMRVIRRMLKTCAPQEIGQSAFALVTAIAATEDAKRYTGPVTFHNYQIMPILGIRKWDTLAAARKAAVDAGWLHYIPPPSGSKAPPIYWTLIPEQFSNLDDSPVDERKASPINGDDPRKAYPPAGDGRGDARGEPFLPKPSTNTLLYSKEEQTPARDTVPPVGLLEEISPTLAALLRALGFPDDSAFVGQVAWLVCRGDVSEGEAMAAAYAVGAEAARPVAFFRKALTDRIGPDELRRMLRLAPPQRDFPKNATQFSEA